MHKHWCLATCRMTETSKLLLTPLFSPSYKDTGTQPPKVLGALSTVIFQCRHVDRCPKSVGKFKYQPIRFLFKNA